MSKPHVKLSFFQKYFWRWFGKKIDFKKCGARNIYPELIKGPIVQIQPFKFSHRMMGILAQHAASNGWERKTKI